MKSKLQWVVTFLQHVSEVAGGSADLMNVKAPLTHCSLFLTTGVSEEKGPLY